LSQRIKIDDTDQGLCSACCSPLQLPLIRANAVSSSRTGGSFMIEIEAVAVVK
jgi:hypothetical protein